MEVRQFQYFASVVECGSMSRASARTGITQPSLSQQIRNLEEELGVPLLVRSAQGVEPTEVGLKLYVQAQRILRALEQAVEETRSLSEGETFEGKVAVGLPNTATAMLGYGLFAALSHKHPAIKLHLIDGLPEHLLEYLMASRIDLALQFGLSKLPALRSQPLYGEVLYFVEREANPTSSAIAWDEVMHKTVVVPSSPYGMRHSLDAYMETHGPLQSIAAEVDSLIVLWDIVNSGDASTFLPWSAIRNVDTSKMSVRQIYGAPLERAVSICTELNPLRPSLTALVAQQFREIISDGIKENRWHGVRLLPAA